MSRTAGLWDRLPDAPQDAVGWSSQRIGENIPHTIRVARANPGGARALLFEVTSAAVSATVEYPESLGFRLFPETVRPGPAGTTRLCLVELDQAYQELFGVLAEDVLGVVLNAVDERDAVRHMFARLREWQACMRRASHGLTTEAQIGLYAELATLEAILGAGLSPDRALSAWVGVEAGLRDFVFGAVALEVKAGLGGGAGRLHVSHLDQLDESTLDTLLVWHYALIEAESGQTLVEIIQHLRAFMSTASAADEATFESKLLEAGFLDAHAGQYVLKFRVQRASTFHVRDDFPRLRRHEQRAGIMDAVYSVDVQACAPYVIPVATVLQKILSEAGND